MYLRCGLGGVGEKKKGGTPLYQNILKREVGTGEGGGGKRGEGGSSNDTAQIIKQDKRALRETPTVKNSGHEQRRTGLRKKKLLRSRRGKQFGNHLFGP